MKRILIAAILGIAATVSTSGQGWVYFSTYEFNNYMGLQVCDGATGWPLHGVWHAQLAYYVGTGLSDPVGSGSLLPQLNLNAAVIDANMGAGMFYSGVYTIPSYPSTGNVPIEIQMLVFNGAEYASSTIRGHSDLVTYSSIAAGIQMPELLNGMSGFSVYLVPEPSTFALVGVGAGVLMICRMRGAR
jgi:hypothetical protein